MAAHETVPMMLLKAEAGRFDLAMQFLRDIILVVSTAILSRPSVPPCPAAPACPTCPSYPGAHATPATPSSAVAATDSGSGWVILIQGLLIVGQVALLGGFFRLTSRSLREEPVASDGETSGAVLGVHPVSRRSPVAPATTHRARRSMGGVLGWVDGAGGVRDSDA